MKNTPNAHLSESDGDPPPATFFSQVRAEPNCWLWRGRIPRGALTLLTGDPDRGKSLLTLDWAARISTGAEWPDGRRSRAGTAVFLSPEDDPRRTIVPRFLAAGGNPDRACFLNGDDTRDGGGTPAVPLAAAVARLEKLLRPVRDVRLVVVDPLNAYLAGVNTGRDGEVRAALGPMLGLARRHGFAVVGVVHMSKSGGGRAMYRSLGSIGIQGVARASWLVGPDPRPGAGADARVMAPVKFNLGKWPPGVVFRLVGAAGRPSVPVVRYDAFDLSISADNEVGRTSASRAGAVDRAVGFLRQLFARRETITSAELFALATAAGVSWRTIARAQAAAGVEAFKVGRGWAYRLAGDSSGANGRAAAS